MTIKPFIIFLLILAFLTTLFSLYHYASITKTIEETSLLIGAPQKRGDGLGRVALPEEFVNFVKLGDSSAKGNLSNELFALKKLAFTTCLYETSSTTNFWKKEGSRNLFTQESKASVNQIEIIEKYTQTHLSKNFFAIKNKGISPVSACLDYYDSRELKETLTSLGELK